MHAITLLQNTIKDYLTLLFVLLPYEFTLLQNLKRRLKLLPVHVSQDFQLHLIISPSFCQKHIDYHICVSLFNYPAILHLFKCSNRHLKLLPAQNARNYTTPKPFTIWYSRNLLFYYPMNLHYSKTYLLRHTATYCFTTLWIYTTPKLNFDLLHWCELFYYPAILHLFKCSNKHLKLLPAQNARNYTTPKPQKKAFRVATSVCITEHSIAFYYITSLLSEKHIECHACANLFNYPAILHLFKCSNRHLKLLPAQKSRKYTTPKLRSSSSDVCKCFSTLWIYTTPKQC